MQDPHDIDENDDLSAYAALHDDQALSHENNVSSPLVSGANAPVETADAAREAEEVTDDTAPTVPHTRRVVFDVALSRPSSPLVNRPLSMPLSTLEPGDSLVNRRVTRSMARKALQDSPDGSQPISDVSRSSPDGIQPISATFQRERDLCTDFPRGKGRMQESGRVKNDFSDAAYPPVHPTHFSRVPGQESFSGDFLTPLAGYPHRVLPLQVRIFTKKNFQVAKPLFRSVPPKRPKP